MKLQKVLGKVVNDRSAECEDVSHCFTSKKTPHCLRLLDFQESTLCQWLQYSSINGLKYVGKKGRPFLERLFWICAVMGVVVVSGYLIRIGVVEPLLGNPVLITFQSSDITVDQIPFPAFTICNTNLVKKSEIEALKRVVEAYDEYVESNSTAEYLKQFGEPPLTEIAALKFFQSICTNSKCFSKKFGYSACKSVLNFFSNKSEHPNVDHLNINHITGHDPLLKHIVKVFPNCSDLILRCRWENKDTPCDELFSPIGTRVGRCCVFNMMPEFIMKIRKLRGVEVKHLNDSEIAAWSNWNIDDSLIDRSSKSRKVLEFPRHQKRAGMATGLSILVNPQLAEHTCTHGDSRGFLIQVHSTLAIPHLENYGKGVGPNEEVFVGVRAQITTADRKQLKGYSYKKRLCYFLGEKVLHTFNFYRKESCFAECIANETWKECGCILLFEPNEGNRSYCTEEVSITCANFRIDQMRKKGIRQKCKTCLPSCTNVEYTSDLSRMPIRDDVRLWIKRNTHIDELWANNSLSIVHVFFESDYVESRVRKSLVGLKAIIADSGGLLGLAMGFSLISLVEPFYFLSLRNYWRNWKRLAGSEQNEVRLSAGRMQEVLASPVLRKRSSRSVSDIRMSLPDKVFERTESEDLSSASRKDGR